MPVYEIRILDVCGDLVWGFQMFLAAVEIGGGSGGGGGKNESLYGTPVYELPKGTIAVDPDFAFPIPHVCRSLLLNPQYLFRSTFLGSLRLYTAWKLLPCWVEFIEEFSGVKTDPLSSLKRHLGKRLPPLSLSCLYSVVAVMADRATQS